MWKQKIINTTLILLSLFTLTGFSAKTQTEEVSIRITQIDTSDFPKVTVYVAITDANGEPVGVDPARIRLMENEVEIPSDQIVGAGEIDPLTVLLAMDISESMLYVGKLEAAKSAAAVFVNQLRPSDKIGLLTFNNEINYAQPITEDRELILSAIDDLQAEEETAMYDALSEGTSILSDIEGRKAIVTLTDGLDNLSQATPDSVLEGIGPAGLSISTIGLGDPDQIFGDITRLDEDTLRYLAENAGGVYGYANNEESLSEIYQSYAVAFKSEYQLTYTSPSTLRDGVNRDLSVSLADSSNIMTGIDQGPITYNPGGLVPEVSEPVPLITFGAIMVGLVALLLVPSLINLVFKPIQNNLPQGSVSRNKKSKIKLID
jgi:VWFA-related protein